MVAPDYTLHRLAAERHLQEAERYPLTHSVHLAHLAAAQVHATLALAPQAPAVLRVPEDMYESMTPEEIANLANSRLIVTTDPRVTISQNITLTEPAPAPAPTPARRPRKATPAKDTTK